MLFALPSYAKDYKIEPYFDAQEIFTDNINLDDNNKDSDFVTVLQPGLYATKNGSRLKARFNYALEEILYANNSYDNTVHNLRTNALAEFWKDHLFLDFAAQNGQQNINANNSVNANNISNTANRENVFYYRVNPFWQQKISDVAKLTIGHTYDEIISDIGDSNSNFSYLNVTNGTRFKRLLFNFELNNRFVEAESFSGDVRFTNIQNRFIYPLSRTFSATTTIGYDDDDYVTTGDTSGILWKLGFIWKPSKRTNIDFSAGERYYGSDYNIRASYAYSKTEVRLTFQRERQTPRDFLVQTPTQIFYDRGASGLVDQQGNVIDNRQFATPTVLDGATINQIGQTTISSILRAVGIYRLKRNIYRLGVFYDENEFQQAGTQIETYGVDASWNRRISRTLQSNLNLVYQNRDLNAGNKTNDYLIDLVFLKNLAPKLNLSFGYSHAIFESDSPLIAEFSENRVFIGINKLF